MILNVKRFLAVVPLLFCLLVSGQEEMSIQQLLQHALENSYEIKNAHLDVEKAAELKKEVKSDGLPQINGKIKYEHYIDQPVMVLPGSLMAAMLPPQQGSDPTQGVPDGTGQQSTPNDIIAEFGKPHNLDIGLQFSQLLFSLQYINGVKTASKAEELYELKANMSERDLVYEIYQNYYRLLSIHKNLEILEGNIESLSKMRDITQLLVESDLALETNVTRIDINISNLEIAKQQALTGVEIQTNNLKMLAGIKRNKMLTIEVADKDKIYSLNSIQLLDNPEFSDIADKRTEIQLLNKQLELNDLQIKTEKGAHAPTVAAYGTYMKQAQEDKFNLYNTAIYRDLSLVGITAEIPIFSGRKTRAKVKQAEIEKQRTLNQKQQVWDGLNVEYQNSVSEFNISLKNCISQEKNIELAREVLSLEQIKYQEGLVSLNDVLMAETELRTTEINFVENMTNFRMAELNLLKSQGKLKTLVNN